MADTMTYKLIHPIEPKNEGGVTIDEIVFHKPSLKELRKHDLHDKHGQYEKVARLLAAGCALPLAILDNLSWEDLQAINEEVVDFLGLEEE